MTRYDVNFSNNQNALLRNKLILGFLVLSLAVLLVKLYVSLSQLESATNEYHELATRLADTSNKTPVRPDKQLEDYLLKSRADWPGLFDTLEKLRSTDITLLSVDPRLVEQRVAISGLAKDQETLNLYLTKLDSSANLSKVELQRYRRTTHSPNGLEFFVTAQWGKS